MCTEVGITTKAFIRQFYRKLWIDRLIKTGDLLIYNHTGRENQSAAWPTGENINTDSADIFIPSAFNNNSPIFMTSIHLLH